ncbi:hypothetical protein SUGI_0929020 [Cryptomeria japonica]|nr:hypothetical protein SUGI_0929020 [Cryptomeria japonica]
MKAWPLICSDLDFQALSGVDCPRSAYTIALLKYFIELKVGRTYAKGKRDEWNENQRPSGGIYAYSCAQERKQVGWVTYQMTRRLQEFLVQGYICFGTSNLDSQQFRNVGSPILLSFELRKFYGDSQC